VRKTAPPTSPGILRIPPYNSDSLNIRQVPKLDKPNALKKGVARAHIHHYDLSLTIKKPKDEDDKEPKIQKALQKFLDIMLQADSSTLIPPYFELERLDKNIPDLGKDTKVEDVEEFSNLKGYFSRLSKRNETTGKKIC
jgi:hypothetical protein